MPETRPTDSSSEIRTDHERTMVLIPYPSISGALSRTSNCRAIVSPVFPDRKVRQHSFPALSEFVRELVFPHLFWISSISPVFPFSNGGFQKFICYPSTAIPSDGRRLLVIRRSLGQSLVNSRVFLGEHLQSEFSVLLRFSKIGATAKKTEWRTHVTTSRKDVS